MSFNYELEKTLHENNYCFILLEFKPNLILSGTTDNVINLWSLYTNKKIYLFIEHTLWENCLIKITTNHYASRSNDNKIIVWNFFQKTEGEIEEHSDCILTIILLDNNNICSGSADNSIKIWNLSEKKCIMNMLGHMKLVKCLS